MYFKALKRDSWPLKSKIYPKKQSRVIKNTSGNRNNVDLIIKIIKRCVQVQLSHFNKSMRSIIHSHSEKPVVTHSDH